MTSFYTALISRFVFPMQERIKHHDTVRIRREMEASQWSGKTELEALRLLRLNDMLRHVGEHVPYYRNLFQSLGMKPGEMVGLSELQRLPFLNKAIIRGEGDGMKSEVAEGLARFNTGGSSGEPLVFFIGQKRISHDVAAKWRATRWWDVDIGDPEIVVWGSPIELGAQDRVRWMRDKIMRTELLPAFEMSSAKLDGFLATIRHKRPKMLFGYPSALSLIASHAEKCGVSMTDLGIKVAFVTSERLYDEQRATIARVFNCAVANGYGGRDAGFIAHQCPHGGMHITAEDVIVELVDPQGRPVADGVAGEIVVTHLATQDFPFIRYRTGDVAVMDSRPCACGRGLPVLKEIQGRSTDFVIAADGTVLHGLALIYILRDLAGVQSFKVVQETRALTRVLLVVSDQFEPSATQQIVAGFKRRLGENVAIEIEMVEAIAPEKSGKFRYIVSHAVPAPTEPVGHA